MELKAIKDLVERYGFYISYFTTETKGDGSRCIVLELIGFTHIDFRKEWDTDSINKENGGITEFKEWIKAITQLYLS